VHVFGFVENMPDLMRASDAVVTKAGPGTISEALISGLPIFLTGYVPGQEEGNVSFVTDQGLGYYTPRVRKLVKAVRHSLVDDREEFDRMQGRAEAVGRTDAAREIAQLIAAAVDPLPILPY
jgi:1,2-diacylglycerol 3-beta-galactosyltransferase